jgi:hypothetical protein
MWCGIGSAQRDNNLDRLGDIFLDGQLSLRIASNSALTDSESVLPSVFDLESGGTTR